MESHRRITEDDLRITETLIAGSYLRTKQSVMQAPHRAYRSGEQIVRDHPYASAATVVVAGLVIYGIISMKGAHTSGARTPGSSAEFVQQQPSSCLDLMPEILAILIPLISPYITGYIQKYVEIILAKEQGSSVSSKTF